MKKLVLTAVFAAAIIPVWNVNALAAPVDNDVLTMSGSTAPASTELGFVNDILRAAGGKDSPFDHDNGRGNDDKWRHDNGRRGNDKKDRDRWEYRERRDRHDWDDDRWDDDRWERDDDDDRWDDDRWERDDDDDRWDDDRWERDDDDDD